MCGVPYTLNSMNTKNQSKSNSVPLALSIAGSDSSGGAGIQADTKTFASLGVFGESVIASITSQNSHGVVNTHHLPGEVVENQLNALFADRKPQAVKTGMLGNEEVVEIVAKILKNNRVRNLVVDPVIVSSSGKRLISKKGVEALKEKLLPLALLVTPNLPETEALTGVKASDSRQKLKAARALCKLGARNVLIKGGHSKGNPDDFFYDGKKGLVLESERLVKENLHGTGCVLSAAIAGKLSQGDSLESAVRSAKVFIQKAILGNVQPAEGMGSVEPLASLYQDAERWALFQEMSAGLQTLKDHKIGDLVPEVQTNMGVGLKSARNHDDVLGIPGRIIKVGEDINTFASPAFGASRHVANIVLTAMKYDSSKRAVINIKYTEAILNACKKLKFSIASFNRADEPKNVKVKEGSSLEWGTETTILKCGFVPDIIYDVGGMGKEEMIRVLAPNVTELVDRVLKIHRANKKRI